VVKYITVTVGAEGEKQRLVRPAAYSSPGVCGDHEQCASEFYPCQRFVVVAYYSVFYWFSYLFLLYMDDYTSKRRDYGRRSSGREVQS